MTITPLSLSTAAASVIQYVMDEYDGTLSKSSLIFLFSILRAALMDPKPFISTSELGPLLAEIGV